jgi:hypothetical protein
MNDPYGGHPAPISDTLVSYKPFQPLPIVDTESDLARASTSSAQAYGLKRHAEHLQDAGTALGQNRGISTALPQQTGSFHRSEQSRRWFCFQASEKAVVKEQVTTWSNVFCTSSAAAAPVKSPVMCKIPRYTKGRVGNWDGPEWKYAAIPRALRYSVVAALLAFLCVWSVRHQEDKASINKLHERIDVAHYEFTMEGVKMLLTAAFNNTNQAPAVDWKRPYPYLAFTSILGFLLVFRCCSVLHSSLVYTLHHQADPVSKTLHRCTVLHRSQNVLQSH